MSCRRVIGLHAYRASTDPYLAAVPWHALLAALIRGADSDNFAALESVFPEDVAEMRLRYNAPGGLLEGESLPSGSTERKA